MQMCVTEIFWHLFNISEDAKDASEEESDDAHDGQGLMDQDDDVDEEGAGEEVDDDGIDEEDGNYFL